MALTKEQQAAYDAIVAQGRQEYADQFAAAMRSVNEGTPVAQATQQAFAAPAQSPAVSFTPGLAGMSMSQKADEYNRLLSQGLTDAQIRAAADATFGSQTATDWAALQNAAKTPPPSPAPLSYAASPAPVAAPVAAPSQSGLVNNFGNSQAVTGYYQQYLGRKPSESEIQWWLSNSPSLEDISSGIAGSQEAKQYTSKQLGDAQKSGALPATIQGPVESALEAAGIAPTTGDSLVWDYNRYVDTLKTPGADYGGALANIGAFGPEVGQRAKTIYDQIKEQQQAGTQSAWSSGDLASTDAAAADFALRLTEAGLSSLYDLGQRRVERWEEGEGTPYLVTDFEFYNKATGEPLKDWDRLANGLGMGYRFDFQDGIPIPYTTKEKSGWVEFREDVLKPGLSLASLAFPAIAPYVAAGNAINAAQKGDWGTAIVSGLTAAGGIPNVPAEVAEGLKTAKTAASVLNAIEKGNPLAIANALSQTDVGKEIIGAEIGGGVTVGDVLDTAKIAVAVDSGQYAQALNYAGNLTNNPNLMVAGSAVNVVQAIESGQPFAIANALGQLHNAIEKASPDEGGITNRVYDDAMVQSGADAFLKAKEAGASDEDAYAAAEAVSFPVADVPPSTAAITRPELDLGEFAGVDQAVEDQKAASTVNIGNAEADTLEEASALARARNPDASSFTFGGQEYSFSASPADIERVKTEAALADIRDASNFNDAYRQARELLGPNQTFEWQGKQYSTATAEERPDLSGASGGAQQDQSDAETVRLIRQNNELVSGNAPDESAAETARLSAKNTEIEDAKIKQNVDAAKAAINSVLGEGTASNIVMQGLSNLHQAVGQTFDFFGGTGAALGLAGADNVMTRVGQGISKTGEALQLESVNEANSNVIKAVQNADGLGAKIWEGAKAIIKNPLSANMAAVELIQEALPIGVAAKVWGLAGKFAAIGADVGLNAIESGGAAYNEKYDQAIKEGKSKEEADREATTAFYIASGVTAATAGVMDTALVNKVTKAFNDAASAAATKSVGKGAVSAAKEAPTEAAEVFATGVITDLALGRVPDIDKILTQSVVEGFVGGKTAGAVDVSSAVDQTVADIAGPAATPSTVAPDVDVATDVASVAPSAAPVLEKTPEVLAENVSAAVESGLDPSSIISDYVTEVLHGGGNVESVIEAATNAAQGTDSQISFDSNFVTITNPSTGIQTAVDVASGVKTTVDTGNNVVTAFDPNTNTTTTVDTNNNTKSQTTVNPDTNTQTTVTVDTNSDVTTQTTINTNANTQTTVVTDPNTNTQTTIKVNIDTGEIVEEVETDIPSEWAPPVINDPVVPDVITAAKTATAKKAAPPQITGSAGLAGGMGAMLPASFDMDETLLPSRVTQKAIDPLARVMEAQAELEKTAMMQQIDPRLLSVLQQRMAPEQQQALQQTQQQQFDRDIGALSRLLSGEPANTSDYYSYGSEDSIDSILGGQAANFKEGGYVEPLKAAEGGMALPLLAKTGGALSHYGGRENYKDGKHVAGEGDGQSDDIPAWLADGEYVLDAELVSALGNGSTKAGVELLDEFRRQIRAHKRGGSLNTIPPKSKSPLSYLRSAEKSLKKK